MSRQPDGLNETYWGELWPMNKVADPGPLGLAGFAMTTFCLSSANANLWHGAGVSGGTIAGVLLRRHRAVAGRNVGVHPKEHLRCGGVHLVRRVLDLACTCLSNFQSGSRAERLPLAIFLLGWTIFTALHDDCVDEGQHGRSARSSSR